MDINETDLQYVKTPITWWLSSMIWVKLNVRHISVFCAIFQATRGAMRSGGHYHPHVGDPLITQVRFQRWEGKAKMIFFFWGGVREWRGCWGTGGFGWRLVIGCEKPLQAAAQRRGQRVLSRFIMTTSLVRTWFIYSKRAEPLSIFCAFLFSKISGSFVRHSFQKWT